MMKIALALLASSLLAAPALAQPGAAPGGQPEIIDDEPPPVSGATTTVIVTTQPPILPQAQPQSAAPGQIPAAPAPQNEPWHNVSHINGQPVKVGERGDYLYKWKTTSISTNPIGWLFGFWGLSVTRAVGTNVAVRVDGNIFDIDNESGFEVGVSAPIYFRRVLQGPFLEPGLIVRDFHSDSCSSCGEASVGPEVLFGWHWTFDSGLNVATAVGAMRDLNSDEPGTHVEPAGYFRVGYAY